MDVLLQLLPLALLVLLTTFATERATASKWLPYWISRKVLHIVAVGSCAWAALLVDTKLLALLIFPIWLILGYLISTKRLLSDEQGRPAWGVLWFPLALLLLLLVFPDDPALVFTAMLLLALCDPLATIFGKCLGKRTYTLSGEPKSLIGNLAFAASAAAVLWAVYVHFNGLHPSPEQGLQLLVVVASLTAAEALGSYGSDNFLVPLLAAFFLADPQLLHWSSPACVMLAASVPFVWLTVRNQKLTLGAAVGASVLAMVIVYKSNSYRTLLPLLFFFLTSILLERVFHRAVESDAKDRQPRDLTQVLVNGGVYGLVFFVIPPDLRDLLLELPVGAEVAPAGDPQALATARWLLLLSMVAAATATADTWASAVGKHMQPLAFDLFRWQRVPAGLSGGISVAGTVAALLGSLSVASLLFVMLPAGEASPVPFLLVAGAGFVGMLLDSGLGSRLQRQHYYGGRWHDQPPAEGAAEKTRGLAWVTNDLVNLLSIAGIVGAVLLLLIWTRLLA